MAAIRVDGNDLFAVHEATKAAREYAVNNLEPVSVHKYYSLSTFVYPPILIIFNTLKSTGTD